MMTPSRMATQSGAATHAASAKETTTTATSAQRFVRATYGAAFGSESPCERRKPSALEGPCDATSPCSGGRRSSTPEPRAVVVPSRSTHLLVAIGPMELEHADDRVDLALQPGATLRAMVERAEHLGHALEESFVLRAARAHGGELRGHLEPLPRALRFALLRRRELRIRAEQTNGHVFELVGERRVLLLQRLEELPLLMELTSKVPYSALGGGRRRRSRLPCFVAHAALRMYRGG